MTATSASFDDDPVFLRSALDATRLLVVVVDRAGTILHANGALRRTADLPAAGYQRPIWELTQVPTERDLLKAGFSPFNADVFPSGVLFHVVGGATSRLVD